MSGAPGTPDAPGDLDLLTDQGLFRATGVRIAFAGRRGGTSIGPFASLNCSMSVGDDEEMVRRNRELLFQALGAQQVQAIVPTQVHGTNVLPVRPGDDPAAVQEVALEDGADALAVSEANVAALLLSADCPLVIIVSPSGAFAVAHAGWRGAVAHIAAKAVRALADLDGCEPAQFNAYIGPHIRRECFEVGQEVTDQFQAEFGEIAIADARHVDLSAAISADLVEAGLDRRRIVDSGLCTICDSGRFFSYRVSDGTCGRHAAVAFRIA